MEAAPRGCRGEHRPFSPRGCRGEHCPRFLLILAGQRDHTALRVLQSALLPGVQGEDGILRCLWDLGVQPCSASVGNWDQHLTPGCTEKLKCLQCFSGGDGWQHLYSLVYLKEYFPKYIPETFLFLTGYAPATL